MRRIGATPIPTVTVWMEEDTQFQSDCVFFTPWLLARANFFVEVNEQMQSLISEIQNNLSFFLTSVTIVAILALVAKVAEKRLPNLRQVTPARRASIIGMCAAIAAVLFLLDFPLVFLAPGFYKLDFSELPVLLCGFYLGPSATVLCEAIKVLLKLLLKGTSTAFVGDLANFIAGCTLALPATIVYHCHKNKRGAIFGLALGTAVMTVFFTIFNALYLIPKFAQLYGIPVDAIIAMGTAIRGGVTGLSSFVILCVAPLNFLKAALVSVLTMLLYKRVAKPLFDR